MTANAEVPGTPRRPSRRAGSIRGALAGATAAAVWAAQQPIDKRVFAFPFDDVELLGKAVTRGPRWRPPARRCTPTVPPSVSSTPTCSLAPAACRRGRAARPRRSPSTSRAAGDRADRSLPSRSRRAPGAEWFEPRVRAGHLAASPVRNRRRRARAAAAGAALAGAGLRDRGASRERGASRALAQCVARAQRASAVARAAPAGRRPPHNPSRSNRSERSSSATDHA